MFHLLWMLISRIFFFVIVGVVLSRFVRERGEKVADAFVWFALYILIPLFIFLTMWTSPVSVLAAKRVVVVALSVVGGGAFLAWLWAKTGSIEFRSHCLPVIFMNSAYLAIPVNALLWGPAGTAYTIIYNMVITIANFTVGIWWVSREKPLVEIASLPVLYAVVAGMAFNVLWQQPPAFVGSASGYISLVTLPVMLIFIGYRLGSITAKTLRRALVGVVLRVGGGFLLAAPLVALLDISGAAAGVCVMTSAMPAAIYSYLLTERYRGNTEFAAAAVFAGTALSVVTIPLIAYLYR